MAFFEDVLPFVLQRTYCDAPDLAALSCVNRGAREVVRDVGWHTFWQMYGLRRPHEASLQRSNDYIHNRKTTSITRIKEAFVLGKGKDKDAVLADLKLRMPFVHIYYQKIRQHVCMFRQSDVVAFFLHKHRVAHPGLLPKKKAPGTPSAAAVRRIAQDAGLVADLSPALRQWYVGTQDHRDFLEGRSAFGIRAWKAYLKALEAHAQPPLWPATLDPQATLPFKWNLLHEAAASADVDDCKSLTTTVWPNAVVTRTALVARMADAVGVWASALASLPLADRSCEDLLVAHRRDYETAYARGDDTATTRWCDAVVRWNALTAALGDDTPLRSDSKLCHAFVVSGRGNLQDVAETMREMRFFFDHTNYRDRMCERERDYEYDDDRAYHERSRSVKKACLASYARNRPGLASVDDPIHAFPRLLEMALSTVVQQCTHRNCTSYASQSCPHRRCGRCCKGCLRHKK